MIKKKDSTDLILVPMDNLPTYGLHKQIKCRSCKGTGHWVGNDHNKDSGDLEVWVEHCSVCDGTGWEEQWNTGI